MSRDLRRAIAEPGENERVSQCLQALREDHERQGGVLALSDVLRAIDRRRLTQEEATDLWTRLETEGLYAPTATAESEADDQELRSLEGAARGDALQSFMRQLATVPKLTDDETIQRIRLVQAGANGRLPPEMADAIEGALDELVRANLRFVVYVARESFEVSDLEPVDVVHQGVLGLLVAIHRFDPAKGTNLRTYAVWWIRQRILEATHAAGRLIKVPQRVAAMARLVRKTRDRLARSLERSPTTHEIATELGMDRGEVQFLLDLPLTAVSLDQPLANAEGLTVGDTVPERPCDSLEATTLIANRAARIRSLLSRLSPQEHLVIERRFGLDGREGATLQEIADDLRLSRERIRQIEERALERLRRDPAWREVL